MSEYTTRQILDMIEANEGPEGLDLSGKDLSGIDLSRETIEAELERVREVDPGAEPMWATPGFYDIDLGANIKRADWVSSFFAFGINLGGANLQRANLKGANLQGALLLDANLQGAHLWGANLQGAYLWGANLKEVRLCNANLQEADLWRADLQEADLGEADFQEADLRGANLQGVSLWRANLQRADLWGANLQEADLGEANLTRVNLLNAESIKGISLYRATLDHTQLTKDQLGGAIGEEDKGEWFEAKEVYLALKNNFEQIGRYDDAAWAYRKERQMEKACNAPWRARGIYGETELGDTREHRVSSWHPKVWWFYARHTLLKWPSDWFVEYLCGYGESILRVLFWMFASFFGFAAYYWRIGGVWLVEPNGEARVATSFWHYLIYSAGAFTTTQFVKLQAADDRVRMVTAIQAIVGIILAGLLGFVAGNRIRRS